MKKIYKKIKKPFIFLIIATLIINVSVIYADEEKKEWNKEKKEEAWNVYFLTEWNKFGLNVDGNGNVSYLNKKLTASGKGYWLNCMEYFYEKAEPNMQAGNFEGAQDPSGFKNLLLAMCGALGDADDDVDYGSYVKKYDLNSTGKNILRLADYSENRLDFRTFTSVDGDVCNDNYRTHATVNNTASAITYMYNNLVRAQQKYNELYGEPVNIYQKDEALKVCIQAALYGSDYIEKNQTYTPGNAQSYYNSNSKLKKTLWISCCNFADTTFELYQAVAATGHSVEG